MAEKDKTPETLDPEAIRAEEEFMEGIPRMNWGAFFIPPIWGPAHGIWATILWYPIWVFMDTIIINAVTVRSVLAIAAAVIAVVIIVAVTAAFGILSQPQSWHRAAARGVDKETFLRRERIWAVVGVVVAIAVIALATWYNLTVRLGVL